MVSNPGTYYVFVRGYAEGGESNGIHIGLNGVLAGEGPGASKIPGFHPVKNWIWESPRPHRSS